VKRWAGKFAYLTISILVTSIVITTLVLSAPADEQTEAFVSIGTGELNGLSYPVAEARCHVAWRALRAQGIWCSPEITPGSVFNVSGIQSGEPEFGIVHSDFQYAAFAGTGAWNGRPVSDLRSVLSLYPELVTVIARADADIQVLADLGYLSRPSSAIQENDV
jgi:TRAP transporter TAXI family solute receptor